MSGYTYLASPYTHTDPAVRDARYRLACQAAAHLMVLGQNVFSPIAHSHPIETIGLRKVKSGTFWKKQDVPLLRHAESLTVLMIEGWQESPGIAWEIALAKELNLPIHYFDLFSSDK